MSQQACALLLVVVRVSLEGQVRRLVADSRQEDDDGAEGHQRGHQEEAEPVHRASDAAPVILLLRASDLCFRPPACERTPSGL